MFDEVLVGIDFGPGDGEAVAVARRLITPGGRLTLAHVATGNPSVYRGQSGPFLTQERSRTLDRLDHERRRFRLAEDEDRGGVRVETGCAFAASAARGLHFMARRAGADLIVIGASRRGALGRILLGDDTRAVLRRSPCTVAVVPAGYRAAQPLRVIGVGYDGSPESRAAVETARELARNHGARLAGVTVVSAVSGAGPLPIQEAREAERRTAKDALAELGEIEPHVLWGGHADRLAAFSRRLDLLVVGSRALSASGPMLRGSTSARLVREAECPVLVLIGDGARPARAPMPDGHRANVR
ncbi:MAG TPA: universal stress protein [Solirubrobacteraceae bacterium]|jgi:nucleotide-binding universal stress UspA family protein|nr:universal stress protein [Solirubrobacteraceae bacterium]